MTRVLRRQSERRARQNADAVDRKAVRDVFVAHLTTRCVLFLIVFVSSAALPIRVGQERFPRGVPRNLLVDGLIE